MPKVSIVMPTRNRAHLLRTALASAAGQTYDDMEIVVSDNYSTDDTKAVVESFSNPKIRYVRTPKALDMPNSWEFAFHYAQGEYVTYLTDDSYLLPNAIEKALTEMQRFNSNMVVWNMCTYYAPDWFEPGWRNLLIVPKYSVKSTSLHSETVLKKIFDLEDSLSFPKVLNTVFDRKKAEEAQRSQGKLFLPSCPDYSAAVGLLQHVKEYVYIDIPLAIDGKFPASIGAVSAFNWGKATQEYLGEFEDKDFSNAIDLNIPTLSVAIAQSLEMMRKYYPDTLNHGINKGNLICRSINDLIIHQTNGVDVRESWQILNAYLNTQPVTVRKAAGKQKVRSKVNAALRKNWTLVPFHAALMQLFGGFVGNWHAFRGDRSGFTNLQQCGEVVPNLLKKMA